MFKSLKKFLKKFWVFRFTWRQCKKIAIFLKPKKKIIKRDRGSVIQLLPTYVKRDAIGNMVGEISNALYDNGIENYIVSENGASDGNWMHLDSTKFRRDDYVVYHMSIGTRCSDVFRKIKVRKKIMIYHNITPSKFFPDNPTAQYLCDSGRKQLSKLSKTPDLSICVSDYNASELKQLGYENLIVVPCVHRIDELLKLKSTKIVKNNKTTFITVGRMAKNKCIEDVIKLFYEYQKYNKNSQLFIIGDLMNKTYYDELYSLVDELKLPDLVKFLGSVTEQELADYYSSADAYICMSEHEGFCIPLVEAMAFNVPIFAYDSTAISSTLSNSGILFKTKNHVENAKIIFELLRDQNKIKDIKSAELERYKYFNNLITLKKYVELIAFPKVDSDIKYLINIYKMAVENFKKEKPNEDFPMKFPEFVYTYKFGNFQERNKKTHKLKNYLKYKTPRFYNFLRKLMKGA